MNLSWIRSGKSAHSRRLGGEALETLLNTVKDSSPGSEYTLDDLMMRLGPCDRTSVIKALSELEKRGAVKTVVRVRSDKGMGIEDFSSLEMVPPEIKDTNSGQMMEVSPENLQALYVVDRGSAAM